MKEKHSIITRFTMFLEEKLMPISHKISTQKHLMAVRDGMVAATPLALLGGLILIVSSPPVNLETIQPSNIFFKFLIAWKTFAMNYGIELELPFRMSMGMMGLFVAIGIAHSLSKSYKLDPLSGVVTSAVTFLTVSAPSNLAVLSQNISKANDVSTALEAQSFMIPSNFLGAEGIFTAIIIGILTTEITRLLKNKGLVIKMPDSVPPAIFASFESIIPLMVSVFSFWGLSLLSQNTIGLLIPELIMKGLQPLVGVVDSPLGLIAISILTQLLWLVGLHGSSIVSGMVGVFELGNLALNADLVTAGGEASYIYTEPFRAFFMIIGGAGATMGLVLLMVISKSIQLKKLGRLAIVPSLFNINEPIIFGTPLVLNPILAIPFVLVSTLNGVIAYTVMSLGLIQKTFLNVPWTTPAPIGAFLATMDWKAPLLVIALPVFVNIVVVSLFFNYSKEKPPYSR